MDKTWFHTVAGVGAAALLSYSGVASASQQLVGLDIAYGSARVSAPPSNGGAAAPSGLDFVAGAPMRRDDIDLRFEPRALPVATRLADDAHIAAAMRVAATFSRQWRAAAAGTAREADRARVALTASLGLVAPVAPERRAVAFEPVDEQAPASFALASSDDAPASQVSVASTVEAAPLKGADAAWLQAPLATRGAFAPGEPLELWALKSRRAWREEASSAVPEPMPIALLAAGGLLLAGWRGRARLRTSKESPY